MSMCLSRYHDDLKMIIKININILINIKFMFGKVV